jgi:hypothetical protein
MGEEGPELGGEVPLEVFCHFSLSMDYSSVRYYQGSGQVLLPG